MVGSIAERMGKLEARQEESMRRQDKTDKTIEAIFSYMREGRDQREQMITGFATMSEQMKQNLAYQINCDLERKTHTKDIQSLKDSRTKARGIIAGALAVSSAVGTVIGWVFGKGA